MKDTGLNHVCSSPNLEYSDLMWQYCVLQTYSLKRWLTFFYWHILRNIRFMCFCFLIEYSLYLSLYLSGLFGFLLGLMGMMLYDGKDVMESGMFKGYNVVTCIVVLLQVWKCCHIYSMRSYLFFKYLLSMWCFIEQAFKPSVSVCRLGAAWSLLWSLNTLTTSLKDLLRPCPSSCLHSFHISCWRTLIRLGKHTHPHASSCKVTHMKFLWSNSLLIKLTPTLAFRVFFFGTMMVIAATFLYGYKPKPASSPATKV